MDSGFSRRRGQRAKFNDCRSTFAYLVAVVLFLFMVVTWMFIAQKATLFLHGTYQTTVDTPHLDLDKYMRKDVPPETSLVQCSLATPSDPSEVAANGMITITVRHDLSPIASDFFVEMIETNYFDGIYIFRVIKGFVAQWGIRHKEIKDQQVFIPLDPPDGKDEIHDQTLSNLRGTLSFAGGNPATKQVFVNMGNNQRLDKENGRPFATVNDAGMAVMDKLYADYKDGQGQVKALGDGLDAIREHFPCWSKVESCQLLRKRGHTW